MAGTEEKTDDAEGGDDDNDDESVLILDADFLRQQHVYSSNNKWERVEGECGECDDEEVEEGDCVTCTGWFSFPREVY